MNFQMTNQQTKRAIQLIAFDNNKNPFITEQALTHLRLFKTTNLHVIAVAGKYRTGKSYILNRVLLGKSNGFNVGHTINACTKGLWMWPQLIKLGQKDCLIIDTEGLGSLQQGQSTDLKIFLLALLFSSYLIYNSVGSIDQQALQSLNLVLQLANVLQRQDRYDSQQLVNTFPAFLWLLRDFSLKLQNDKGDIITSTQYLEHALKHQPKTSTAADRKNLIRNQIRTFFQERDCFALVRPTQEERDLQNLSSLSQNRLRPEFVKLINDLKLHISVSVKPKKVRGRVLSIEGFIELCKYYTKALVDGKLPTISSHWDNLCLGQTHRIFHKYQLQHIKSLQSEQQTSQNFHIIHKQIVKAGLQAIDKSFLGKLQKQLFKQRFQRRLQNQYQQIKIRKNNKKNSQIKTLLESIQDINNDAQDLTQRYDKMMQKMSHISENSSKDDGVYCQLFLCISQFSRNLLQESQIKKKHMQSILNQRINQLQNTINSLRQNQNKNQDIYDQKILVLKKDKSQYNSSIYEQSKQNEQKHIEQILNFKSQLKQLNKCYVRLQEKLSNQLQKQKELLSKIEQKNQQIQKLQQKQQVLQIQLLKQQELTKQDGIKIRKLFREKQIVKNRYQQYLQQNLKFRRIIDDLQHQINQLDINKHPQSKYQYSQVYQLKKALRKYEQENRNLAKVINDQRNTYQTMIMSPQNMNIIALKRNLELQIKEKQIIQSKLLSLYEAIQNCQIYKCSICSHTISGNCILQHSNICHSRQNQMCFDVTYHYNCEGIIQFQIQIDNGFNKWTVAKRIQQICHFISDLDYHNEDKAIFQNQNISNKSQLQNLNQQRRVFLDQLLNQLRNRAFNNQVINQFLQINAVESCNINKRQISINKRQIGQSQNDGQEIVLEHKEDKSFQNRQINIDQQHHLYIEFPI